MGTDEVPHGSPPSVYFTYVGSTVAWKLSAGKIDEQSVERMKDQWGIGLAPDGHSIIALTTSVLGFYVDGPPSQPLPVGGVGLAVCQMEIPACRIDSSRTIVGIRVAALGSDGVSFAYSTGRDIHFTSVTGPERRGSASAPSVAITALRFSPNDGLLAVGLRGGQISVWDKTLRAPVRTLQYTIQDTPAAVRSLYFDLEPGTLISVGEDGGILKWKFLTSQPPGLVHASSFGNRQDVSLDAREELGMVRPEPPRALVAVPVAGSEVIGAMPVYEDNSAASVSETGMIAYGGYYSDHQRTSEAYASILNPPNPRPVMRITDQTRGDDGVTALSFSPSGNLLAIGFDGGGIDLWNMAAQRIVGRLDGHAARINALAFSSNGELLASASTDKTIRLWNPRSATPVRILSDHNSTVLCLSFSIQDGGRLLASGGADNRILLWDANNGQLVRSLEGHSSAVNAVASDPQRKMLVSGGEDGALRFWDTSRFQLLATLLPVSGGNDWLATTPTGFFDGEEMTWGQVLWQFNGNLFDVSPVEIGFRDYFFPKLLARAVEGQLPVASRSLAELNRAQPTVRIVSVTPDSHETVHVDVEVESATSPTQRDEAGKPRSSGVYDVRVFRNRQLVRQWPEISEQAGTGSEPTIEEWRRLRVVPLQPDGKATVPFSHIRLPRPPATGVVEFTAYAFNDDRVKSLNSKPFEYPLQPVPAGTARRAFLITMGVNANQSGWNLDVAVSSAEQARSLLHAKLLEKYSTVIDVPVYSDLADNGEVESAHARKNGLKAALDLLSGGSLDAKLREEIDPNHQLQAATPDDAVVLYVASRGYADPQGTLYLVPYDTGAGYGITEEVLSRCLLHPASSAVCRQARYFLEHSISSADLAAWWQAVDAGELIMILDSCHSGAVPGRDFRPGPLGDPGFGQLSYDKRISVLSSSQPTQTELGLWITGGEGRTLLMEALETVARTKPLQTLGEWLKGAELQLPITMKQLYPEVREDNLQLPLLLDFGAPSATTLRSDSKVGTTAPQPSIRGPPALTAQPH